MRAFHAVSITLVSVVLFSVFLLSNVAFAGDNDKWVECVSNGQTASVNNQNYICCSGIWNTGSICDTTSPITSISPNGKLWTNTNVIASLSCSDSESGCKETRYATITSATCPSDISTLTQTGTLTTVGCPDNQVCKRYVCFGSENNAGLKEAVKTSSEYQIDKIAPTSSILGPATPSWQSSNTIIDVSDSDSDSKLSTCFYDVDDAGKITTRTTRTCDNDFAILDKCATNGAKCSISIYAKDFAGNEGNKVTRTYDIDLVPPTGTVKMSPTSPSGSIDITYSATGSDYLSGLKQIEIFLDGVRARNPCTSSTCNYIEKTCATSPPDKLHSYYAKFTDNAGNVYQTPANEFKCNSPSITLTLQEPKDGKIDITQTQSIMAQTSDARSGVIYFTATSGKIPTTCDTNTIGNCVVTFTPTEVGKIDVKATKTGYNDGSVQVEVFDFAILPSPTSGSVAAGQSAATKVEAKLISGPSRTVKDFSCSGLPAGSQCVFGQASCSPTCTSDLTIKTSSSTPKGTYPITIAANGGGLARTGTYSLSVTSCSLNSVKISPQCAGGSSGDCEAGEKIKIDASYSGSTCPSTSYIQVDAKSADGQCWIKDQGRTNCPTDANYMTGISTTCTSGTCTGYWTIPTISSGCTGQLVDAVASTIRDNYPCAGGAEFGSVTPTGSFKFYGTDTDNGGSGGDTPPFTISANPSSLSFEIPSNPSTQQTSTISVKSSGSFSSAVGLSGSWIGSTPTGVTYSFNPLSVTPPAGGTATSSLQITVTSTAVAGTYTFRITGTGGSTTQSTDLSVSVNEPSSVCTRRIPSLMITPDSQSGAPSARLTYQVSVTNNDESVCDQSPFSLSFAMTGQTSGWVGSFSPSFLSLSPGETQDVNLYVTSPNTALDNTYIFYAAATNDWYPDYSGRHYANYVVDSKLLSCINRNGKCEAGETQLTCPTDCYTTVSMSPSQVSSGQEVNLTIAYNDSRHIRGYGASFGLAIDGSKWDSTNGCGLAGSKINPDSTAVYSIYDNFVGTTLDASKWVQNAVNSITHTMNNYFRFEDASKSSNNYWIYDGTDKGSQHQSKMVLTNDFSISWQNTVSDTVASQVGQGGIALIAPDDTVVVFVGHGDWSSSSLSPRAEMVAEGSWSSIASGWTSSGNVVYKNVLNGDMRKFSVVKVGNSVEVYDDGVKIAKTSITSAVSKIALVAGTVAPYSYLDYVQVSSLSKDSGSIFEVQSLDGYFRTKFKCNVPSELGFGMHTVSATPTIK